MKPPRFRVPIWKAKSDFTRSALHSPTRISQHAAKWTGASASCEISPPARTVESAHASLGRMRFRTRVLACYVRTEGQIARSLSTACSHVRAFHVSEPLTSGQQDPGTETACHDHVTPITHDLPTTRPVLLVAVGDHSTNLIRNHSLHDMRSTDAKRYSDSSRDLWLCDSHSGPICNPLLAISP